MAVTHHAFANTGLAPGGELRYAESHRAGKGRDLCDLTDGDLKVIV